MKKGLGLFLVCSFLFLSIDSRAQEYIEPIDIWNFDRDLLPSQHLYGKSWDSLNVDSPRFNRDLISWGYILNLVEDDCQYHHPCPGATTSKFGWRRGRMHKGIDLKLHIGDPVYAAFDGIVRISKYNAGGFGNYVMIRHYNGIETLYAHLSESIVLRNQTVRAGQLIGFGGSTGRSTGPHLHFECRFLGQAFNPEKIIDFSAQSLKQPQALIEPSWYAYLPKNLYTSKGTYNPPRTTSTRKYHTVRKGDTLYAIARKNSTSVKTLCRLNGIRSTTTLRIGRRLRVK